MTADLVTTTERMVFKAARLSAIVHGDGGAWDIGNHINYLGTDELRALVVVLAGMVDPEQTVEQALGYITWDEHGEPFRQAIPRCTVRELADQRLRALA
ncbi:hypothetical protein ABZW30_12585 [Kitasatospora sp. NPDC004669]|uniref:hypothetical protein n=1 Tax=Kitasatospora sp. NPDC004669 TaxID=3154555 RepID=UPI0033A8A921